MRSGTLAIENSPALHSARSPCVVSCLDAYNSSIIPVTFFFFFCWNNNCSIEQDGFFGFAFSGDILLETEFYRHEYAHKIFLFD